MHISESLVGRLSGPLDAARIRNITGYAPHPARAVQAFDSCHQCIRFNVREHDLHARLHKSTAKREPDPTCSACDERCLAGKLLHDIPLLAHTRPIAAIVLAFAQTCKRSLRAWADGILTIAILDRTRCSLRGGYGCLCWQLLDKAVLWDRRE